MSRQRVTMTGSAKHARVYAARMAKASREATSPAAPNDPAVDLPNNTATMLMAVPGSRS